MRRRHGMVMAAVLVILALAAMVAAGLLFRMTAEVSASAAQRGGEQAYAAALSGIQHAMAVLRDYGDDPTVWTDNPDLFANQLVWDDGSTKWYFTLYAQNPSDPRQLRYGVSDESGKINVNYASADMLLALPNMTSALVDCLLDYRDGDSDARPEGAEQDYYDSLKHPYLIPNGRLGTLEELLLVKGFTARTVYGEDANLSGLLDPNEDDGDESFPPDDGDGQLNAGLRKVLTVYSTAPPQQNDSRVNLNDARAVADLELPAQTLEFIALYLAEGNRFAHPSQLLEMEYTLKKDAKGGDGREWKAGDVIESGVGADELPYVIENLRAAAGSTGRQSSRGGQSGDGGESSAGEGSAVIGESSPGGESTDSSESSSGAASSRGGRIQDVPINVNTAPAEVLAALPGLDADLARAVVDVRSGLDAETLANYAWLYTRGAVDAATFKRIAPLATTRGYQFRVHCMGFGSPCGRYRVLEAVIDVSSGTPRIVYMRDLTRLGLPFAPEAEKQEL